MYGWCVVGIGWPGRCVAMCGWYGLAGTVCCKVAWVGSLFTLPAPTTANTAPQTVDAPSLDALENLNQQLRRSGG